MMKQDVALKLHVIMINIEISFFMYMHNYGTQFAS